MFEQILIQNFQTHDKLKIDLDPEITCIVGASRIGKSAVIRALRWVCTNQPGGDEFVRWGAKGCTVKLKVDGKTIARRRSPGGAVNTYHIDDAEFKAFGRGVPEPIQDLLNLGPVCWQGQFDAPYWFSETPGEVSRRLNAIVNLSIIDDTLAEVGRRMNKARTRLEVAEEILTTTKKSYDELDWVADCNLALAIVEAREADRVQKAQKAAQAAELQRAIQTHRATLENATRADLVGRKMVELGRKALEVQKRANLLLEVLATAYHYRKIAGQQVPDTKAMENARDRWWKADGKAGSLMNAMDDIRLRRKILCQKEKELKEAEAAVPTKCPTCGQSLPPTSTSKRARR